MIAAKHFDPVMGVDIHIIQPPGPVPPIPIPHPFIGTVMDVFDYVPFLGATVYVNGVPRATAGTEVKNVPHIPIGGMFVPPPPGNEGEIFMGSSTVLADDEPLSSMGMPVLSCQSIGMMPPVRKKVKTTSMVLPTSVVLAVPAGLPVLVGGSPTISMMAMGMRAVMGGLGKLKKLKKFDNAMKGVSKKAHDAASKAMKKMGVPPNIQNKIHKSICSVTGHPVDIVTGKVFTDFVDFELPGPIPLKWERIYYSCSVLNGRLGYGWHHSYDLAIAFDDDKEGMAFRTADGRGIPLPVLVKGETYFEAQEKLMFFRDEQGYAMRDKDQLIYRFSKKGMGANKIHPLTRIENKAGFAIQFQYNMYGYLSGIIDSAGRELKVLTGQNGRITSVQAPHPVNNIGHFSMVRYEYDENGDLAHAFDALGHRSTFEYDKHLLVKETNRKGLSFYFEYKTIGDRVRCIRTWGDGGIYNHKLDYNLKAKYTVVTNSMGHFVAHFWNDMGVVWKEVDAKQQVTQRQYGKYAELLTETDPLGRTTEYGYDDRQNIVSVAEAHGAVTGYAYNDSDQLISVTDPNGASWSWSYDDKDRLVSRKNPEGLGASYMYDEIGLLSAIEIDGTGTSKLAYDENYNLVSLLAPNKSESYWKYDKLGRCTVAAGPNSNVQFREFDLMGQIKKIREPDGNNRVLAYDPEGNVIKAKDVHHNVEFDYAPMGRLKSRMEGGTKIDFQYNTEQDLIGLENEKRERYYFERDKSGLITREVGFDGLIRTYIRDAAGQVNKVLRPGSKASEYEYDQGGRIVRVEHSDGSYEVFHYDLGGNLIEAINEHATVTFKRDALGRVTEEWLNGFTVESKYNEFGRNHLKSSLGADVKIKHNDQGWIESVQAQTEVTDSGAKPWEASFKYDAVGLEIERKLSGDIRSSYERDGMGRPIAHTVSQNGQRVRAKRYNWDSNDRLTQIVDDISYGRIEFSHDTFGNLIRASYSNGEEVFRTADEVGNLFKTKNKTDRKYNKGSRLASSTKWKYDYDAEGNLSSKKHEKTNETWGYLWYANGMLEAVVRPNGNKISFKYDALGRRIEKNNGSVSTHWIWDGNVPLHEWQQASKIPSYTVDEIGSISPAEPKDVTTWIFEENSFVPMAKLTAAGRFSIITDYLGTPAEMYDESGEKVWSCDLDIYGKVRNLEGNQWDCPFRYQGQYEDVETGLYYNRFRYYDVERGGYVSQDPIRLEGSYFNIYSFVHDPSSYIDVFALSAVVIGEGQVAVDEAAKGLKSAGYDVESMNVPKSQWKGGASPFDSKAKLNKAVDWNSQWLESKIRKGYTIVDIGVDGRNSVFYKAEQDVIKKLRKEGVKVKIIKLHKMPGGETISDLRKRVCPN